VAFLAELNQIEKRLDQDGDSKAVRKAFWRIIGQMKRQDPKNLDEACIIKAAELRNRLFKQKVILSVRKGLLLFFLIALVFFWGNITILLYLEPGLTAVIGYNLIFSIVIMNVLLAIVAVFVAYGVYPWGRYLGGVIARVKFEGFYRYSPGELGLKIEYISYLKSTQSRRKWVFGFPIIWVFGFLFIMLPIAWVLNPYGLWAPVILIIMFGIFYLVIYRAKTGELYRFVRELRIAREVKRRKKSE
jgi:Flp pilus assembly protein TadB